MRRRIKYLVVTDTPAPWREKVYEYVYNKCGNEFHVVYCNYNEKRRLWTFPLGNYPKTFLKGRTISQKVKERFINLGVIPFVLKNRPEIVIWFSFQPTVILSLIVSKLIGSKLAVLSDTWLERDRDISVLQKLGRRLAYNHCADAFVGVSRQTLNMYRSYTKNANKTNMFLSPLCADNECFEKNLDKNGIKRNYDIMFSGRIVEVKNPLFFADVAKKIKERNGTCSVLIIGEGDEKLKNEMFRILIEGEVEYHFAGFVEHKTLPKYYCKSKILLLPTSGDCWGVVINEAMISGTPVVTTNKTAAAGELVIDGKNGFVLPMEAGIWAERVAGLLRCPEELESFSRCARETVGRFNFGEAAKGMISAIKYLKGGCSQRDKNRA